MRVKLLVFGFVMFMLSCKREDSIQNSIIGDWEAISFYEYYYCSSCPAKPEEYAKTSNDISNSGIIFKKVMLNNKGEVRLLLNYPNRKSKDEEWRGSYSLKSDSIFFAVQEVYFDGVKQIYSDNLYVDPDAKNILPADYLSTTIFKYKFTYVNDSFELYQTDYDRSADMDYIDHNGVKFTKTERTAKTEKAIYKRK